ncbi:hypothetical protein GGI35DRAFT_472426 [Trichoderma velutinum]
MPPKKLTPDSYRVGWICPLQVEQVAAMQMLDEEHAPLAQSPADHNVYKLGSINGHNVVIAGLPQTGNCPAATVVTQMRMTFQNLRYGLLVGIGGGVPVETDSGMIRLGHVVVSKPTGVHSGAVQYDHGKAREGYFERTGSLMPPPATLLSAAQALDVERDRMDYDPVWEDTKRFKTERPRLRRFKFPGIANDHLYQSDYNHQQMGMSCEEAGCSPEQRIERPVEDDDECFVVVHRGTIASGELVIKDAKQRDRLAQQYGLLCFEMEAAGALADFPCMVIRGISDYCDSHKNDYWHGFAAAAAAAYARQFQCKPVAFNLPSYLPGINRVEKFIARDKELTKMQEALQGAVERRRVVVLHGLGGIGKTQLAIEYAHRHCGDYSTSVWLDARDETTINEGFTQLAERILSYDPSVDGISMAVESQDQGNIVAAVKRWFDKSANNGWLIIYDNYDNPDLGGVTKDRDLSLLSKETAFSTGSASPEKAISEPFDIRKYIPEADHGAIVVTTRVFLNKLGICIQLDKFEHLPDCLEILATTSGRENIRQDKAATDLARRLDGLPLALASAGAYLEQVPMTCTEYVQLYESSWERLYGNGLELPSYDRALCTTWNISYTHIEEKSPNAALLLRQWAYFDNKDLWYELLQDGGSYKPDWVRELVRDSLTFHNIMRLLCSHGLVQANPPNISDGVQHAESAGYSVHACVHSWMIHVLNRDTCEEMSLAALDCVGSHVPEREQPKFWLKQMRLLKHADRCYDTIRAIHVEDNWEWMLDGIGQLYAELGRYNEGEAMYQRALQGREKAWGPEHTSTLNTVNNLGLLYRDLGKLSEAEDMLQRALQGKEKAWGPEHTSTLDTVNNLGLLYRDLGKLSEAEDMLQRALQGYEKAWGPEHTSTLNTVNNLGTLYRDLGKFSEAEDMLQRALQGYEKAWGLEHTLTLYTVYNLGLLYSNQDRYREAEAMYQQALQGYERIWGPEHTLTLHTLNSLSAIYRAQGKYGDREDMYQQQHKEDKKRYRVLNGNESVSGTGNLKNRLGELKRKMKGNVNK